MTRAGGEMAGMNVRGRVVSDAMRLLDEAAATWLTIESCRDKVDDDTPAMIDDALAALDEVATLARMVRPAPDAATSGLGDLREVDALASAIYEHLRDTTAEGG